MTEQVCGLESHRIDSESLKIWTTYYIKWKFEARTNDMRGFPERVSINRERQIAGRENSRNVVHW